MGRLNIDGQLEQAQKQNQLVAAKVQIEERRQYLQYLNRNITDTRKRPRGWTVPDSAERDMDSADRRKAMSKARQKVEESPIIHGMIEGLVDNVVGPGFVLSMQTADPDYNKLVEGLWYADRDKLDIRGVRNWWRLQRMWFWRKVVDGDVGVVLADGGVMERPGNPAFTESYLQTVEADRIARDATANLNTDTGIDYNRFGRPVRYWVSKRSKDKQGQTKSGMPGRKSTPIDAKDFIHYANFPQERAERMRGVCQILQALNNFTDLESIMEAMMHKVKKEAFYGLNFRMDAGTDGGIMGSILQTTKTAEDGKKRSHVKMVPGMNVRTDEGETVDIIESKSPNTSFDPFIRFILRYSGAVIGMPLEFMLLDFTGLNYSSARAMMEVAKKRWRVEQKDLADISSRAFNWWLARQIKHNGLEVPSAVSDTAWLHRWVTPGWPYLDPQKEVQAYIQQLGAGLTTRSRILAEQGDVGDVEDVIEQLGKETKLMRDAALPIVVGLPGQTTEPAEPSEPAEPTPPEDDDE